jgi:hypothetical protein
MAGKLRKEENCGRQFNRYNKHTPPAALATLTEVTVFSCFFRVREEAGGRK